MQIFRKPSTFTKDILQNWDCERSEQQFEAWFKVLKLDSSLLIVDLKNALRFRDFFLFRADYYCFFLSL